MNKQQIYEYYSNDFIVKQILGAAKGREIAGAFWDGSYDKRPNMIQFPADVLQMARKGVSSFHLSVEHWNNAMALTAENTQNYDSLRSGWDLVLDIDSKLGLEESQITARLIVKCLERYGIHNYGIKFSGRRGFHIVLRWNMFPSSIDYKPAEKMYPLVPRVVSHFIRRKIGKKLLEELIKRKSAKTLIEMMGEAPTKLSPYFFVEVEKNWGSRHMFRAPFSLNEKTWLASVPLSRKQLRTFDTVMADPKYVVAHSNTYETFFKDGKNEAENLLLDAMDWYATQKKAEPVKKKQIVVWENKITEEYFPPCIKNIMTGLVDGRKRSIFTLINFLRMMNWSREEIEQRIFEWNEKNRPPLPRAIIIGQLRGSQRRNMMPVNCPPDGDQYYGDTVNVCRPDRICTMGKDKIMIKNPIVYPFKIIKSRQKAVKQKKVYRGYSCGICNKEFKNMRSLAIHKSRTHDVSDDF
jgi:DNA primase large subunit